MLSFLLMFASSFMCSVLDEEEFINRLNELEQLVGTEILVQPFLIQPSESINNFSSICEYQNNNATNTIPDPLFIVNDMFSGTENMIIPEETQSTQNNYENLNEFKSELSEEFHEYSINQHTQINTILSETDKDTSKFNNTSSILENTHRILNFDSTSFESLEKINLSNDIIEGLSTVNTIHTQNIYSSPAFSNAICNEENKIQCPIDTLNLEYNYLNSLEAKKSIKRKYQVSELNSCEDNLKIEKRNTPSEIPRKFKNIDISVSNNLETNFKGVIQYTLLSKYSRFIFKLETLFIEFLEKSNLHENYTYRSIYGLNLTILNDFSFDIFGKLNLENIDMLKIVSTTADMLNQFILFCNQDKNSDLFFDIKTIIDRENILDLTDEKIYNFLLEEIFNFLKSSESIYLKSVCTEFYSFVDLYDKLEIQKNASVVNAFIAFLLLVKRNSIVIYELKIVLRNSIKNNNKHKIINTEKCYSSAFLFVFINNLDFSDSSKIKSNMCTNIIYNCISDCFNGCLKRKVYMQIIIILKIFFFYLKDCDIFYNRMEIFESHSLSSEIFEFYIKRAEEIKKIESVIENIRNDVILKVRQILNEISISTSLKRILFDFLNEKTMKKEYILNGSKLNICLDLIYTLLYFQDCKIYNTISNVANYIYKRKKSNSKKQKTNI